MPPSKPRAIKGWFSGKYANVDSATRSRREYRQTIEEMGRQLVLKEDAWSGRDPATYPAYAEVHQTWETTLRQYEQLVKQYGEETEDDEPDVEQQSIWD